MSAAPGREAHVYLVPFVEDVGAMPPARRYAERVAGTAALSPQEDPGVVVSHDSPSLASAEGNRMDS